MIVAIALWQDRIAPVFDVSRRLLLVEIEEGEVREIGRLELPGDPMDLPLRRLVEAGVDELICGAVSRPLTERLSAWNIRVHAFRTGSLDEVLQALLEGRIDDDAHAMPGCCRRRRRRGRRDGEGPHGRRGAGRCCGRNEEV